MSTCRSAITCFSDLLLTIGDTVENPTQRQNMMSQIIHYRNTLFDSIFASLVSSEVPRDIKPDLFSCLSCMFWELSDYCLVLVERCLTSTFGAADYPVEELESDDDWEWADRLYCAVVEVWDAMNMAVARNGEPIRQAFPRMMEFACRVTDERPLVAAADPLHAVDDPGPRHRAGQRCLPGGGREGGG